MCCLFPSEIYATARHSVRGIDNNNSPKQCLRLLLCVFVCICLLFDIVIIEKKAGRDHMHARATAFQSSPLDFPLVISASCTLNARRYSTEKSYSHNNNVIKYEIEKKIDNGFYVRARVFAFDSSIYSIHHFFSFTVSPSIHAQSTK